MDQNSKNKNFIDKINKKLKYSIKEFYKIIKTKILFI